MNEEKVVFLLIGQRGSGKSAYGQRLLENHPDLTAISRDEILIRFSGSVHLDPYSGTLHCAYEAMCRLVRFKLTTQAGVRILLDCWTGSSRERQSLLRKLREYGATRVVALYFITPLEVVEQWFWQKPGIAKASEMATRKGEHLSFFEDSAPRYDHQLFHERAATLEADGFDEVIRVDPQTELVNLG